MNSIFSQFNTFIAIEAKESINYRNLNEATDNHALHVEYTDTGGVVLAQFAKVYKKTGLFHLFNADSNLHGEIKDADGKLLLTTTSYWGATKREAKVEIHHPDGTLFGILCDANWGADFELPDSTVVGKARRPVRRENEPQSGPTQVVHTYMDASDQIVGTCDRHYDLRAPEDRDVVSEVLTLRADTGPLVQIVTIQESIDPILHTFLFLFPALQHLRTIRRGIQNWRSG